MIQIVRPHQLASLLILSFLSACCLDLRSYPPLPAEAPRWFESRTPNPRGSVLLIHGLNLRASALDQLSSTLAERGFHTYRMTLTGHNQAQMEYFDETKWYNDVKNALREVQSRHPNLPRYAIGYSLGGLLLTHVVADLPPDNAPNRMVLIAPALSLNSLVDLSSALRLPPPIMLATPNLAPDEFRRYPRTPLFWYSNTLTAYRATDSIDEQKRLSTIPTLIFLNPHDELVSMNGTRNWLERNHLTPQWKVELLHPPTESTGLNEHLLIDQTALGRREWHNFVNVVERFLAVDREGTNSLKSPHESAALSN